MSRFYEFALEHPYPDLGDADAIYWAKDWGVLVRRGRKWWASNDTRWKEIGVRPNDELCQPTLGPFTSRRAAADAYGEASEKAQRASLRRLAIIQGSGKFLRKRNWT